mgnify:CR=1 FL=1
MRGQGDKRILILLGAMVALAFVQLLVGPGSIGLPPEQAARSLILWEIRMPRAVLALVVGAGLGMAGAALQGYLKNPLAEPSVLGISGGAAVGGVLAIHTGLAATVALSLPLMGLAGAIIATALVAFLAGERSGPLPFILAGVAVASLAGALIALILNLTRNPFAATESIFWLMGSLVDRSRYHLFLASPLILFGMVLLWRQREALDALTLGDEVAHAVGHDLERLRWHIVLGVALTVGAATAVTGIIGFVGLIVPHIMRGLIGPRPSRVLAASAIGGAILVMAADIGVRLIAPMADIRIGVVTATLGAPFFAWLVVRMRRGLSA